MEPIYKVGDKVLLLVEIKAVDPVDELLPYKAGEACWFSECDVFALVSKSVPAQPEPTTEPLKVAEFARTRDGAIGQIIKTDDDDDTVWILFADAEFHWLGKSKLTRTVKPAAWPF